MFWSVSYPWNTERERLHKWMNMCAQPIPVRFLPSGPLGIGTRTYFSSHVLDMFDKELLVNSPAVVSELNWGGVCIDLLQNSLKLILIHCLIVGYM